MAEKQRQPLGKGYKEEFDLLQLGGGGSALRSGDSAQPREASENARTLEALWTGGGSQNGENLDQFLNKLGDVYVEEGRVKWDPPPNLEPAFVTYFSQSLGDLNNLLQAGTMKIDEDGNIRPA